jgi:CubicO group peptidase (beta-lactamase class C family)
MTCKFFCIALVSVISFGEKAGPLQKYPDPSRILFWSPQEKPFGFLNMEKIASGRVVRRGSKVATLPYAANELQVQYSYQGSTWTTDRFMENNNVAGLLVLHKGKILLERYALGLNENGRWTSFSVAKSVTSTLVGAALQDGKIKSIEDRVTDYLPQLAGTAYQGVSVHNLLNMASGVKWNEDYADPKSDVATPNALTLRYLAKLPRAADPGTRFNYNSAETNLVGDLVASATGKPLSTYLSEKIWVPLGMEQDAFWKLDSEGIPEAQESGGCCLSMSLRDYGRFAVFIQNDGVINGARAVPDGWIHDATKPTQASLDTPRNISLSRGYGYLWWTGKDGSYYATGIFGQHIQFFPRDQLVIISLSAWPTATDDANRYRAREAYQNAVREAVTSQKAAQ